jgi:hypothetical protein
MSWRCAISTLAFDPAQGNIPYAPEEQTGIMENLKNKLSGFTTPAMSFLKKIGGQRSPEKQAAYEAIMGCYRHRIRRSS